MDREEFYSLLDIDHGSEFQYFENLAELLESSEDIGDDLIYQLLQEVRMETLEELLDQYFEQQESWIPDGETEFFMLMTGIRRVLCGLARSISGDDPDSEDDPDDKILQMADELGRFRMWYSCTDNVECRNMSNGEVQVLPVRDALGCCMEEKLGELDYQFDFSGALSYELNDYMMSFADLVDLEETGS